MTTNKIRLRTFLGAKLQRNSGGPHFRMSEKGPSIAYTYIRKNACSSFKRFILKDAESSTDSDFGRMLSTAHIKSLREFKSFDYRIFIYRDPVERLISLYINKFIQNDGHEDLFHSYQRLTGNDPLQASFDTFVTDYVMPFKWKQLDPHLKPQLLHLAPAQYTHAIPMYDIYPAMAEILGQELADDFFSVPVNATKQAYTVTNSASLDTIAKEHSAEYAKSGALPKKSIFRLSSAIIHARNKYKLDYKMITKIEN